MLGPNLIYGSSPNALLMSLPGGDVVRRDAPLLMMVTNPKHLCVMQEIPAANPFRVMDNAMRWLRDAAAPLEMIAGGLVKHGLPQQLLTVGQSVSLTFLVTDAGHLELSVHYSCRDVRTAVLVEDFPAFSYGLQLLSLMTGLPVGRVFIYVAQPVFRPSSVPVEDPPVEDGLTLEDHETFISELGLLLEEMPLLGTKSRFIRRVLIPMRTADALLGAKDFSAAAAALSACEHAGWKATCLKYVDFMRRVNDASRQS